MAMTKPTSEQVTFLQTGTGATARTVDAKLKDTVSVKDFGAVGDGATDDTAAFTAAITAAGTKNVYVPGGSYAITGTVTGSFYSDGVVTIVGGTVNTVNRIGSVLSTTGTLAVTGNLAVNTNMFTVAASSGDTLAAGILTATGGVSTSQLQFPATQLPSTQVNTLDDYKEGTWVPVMTSAGATFTAVSEGVYQKIGKQVTVWGYVDTSSVATGTLTNVFSIAGLPYTSNNLGFGYPVTISNIIYIDWIVGALQIIARIPPSSTEIQLFFATATVVSQFLASAMDSSDSRISFSATYQTLT